MKTTMDEPFGFMLSRLINLNNPPLRVDEIDLITKCHTFFRICQAKWIKKVKSTHLLRLDREQEWNLMTGGECSVFEIHKELKKALYSTHPKMCEHLTRKLVPDFFKNHQFDKELPLEFCIHKITNKLVKAGINVSQAFRKWDVNNSGHLDAHEILYGITNHLGIFLSQEEAYLLT